MGKLVLEVGKVYGCGEGFVKIIFEYVDEDHPTCFYKFVGIRCYESGSSNGCQTGMFGTSDYFFSNPEALQHSLVELPTKEDKERLQKLERIAKIEAELQKLKEEL